MRIKRPLRVALADDYPAIRTILRTILSTDSSVEVVGEAFSATSVLALCRQEHPDILLLDLFMPDLAGPLTIQTLLALTPELKIIVVSGDDDDVYVGAVAKLPVCGYLLKGDVADCLLEAVHAVAGGATWYSPSLRVLWG